MTTYILQIGAGGIGDDPLITVRHSQEIDADDDRTAVAQAIKLFENDPAYSGTDRAVLVADDGSVIWFRPTGSWRTV